MWAELIEHLGKSMSIPSYARLSLVRPLPGRFGSFSGCPYADEANHDLCREERRHRHDTGCRENAGLDQLE
jgi:hypothetical protein